MNRHLWKNNNLDDLSGLFTEDDYSLSGDERSGAVNTQKHIQYWR